MKRIYNPEDCVRIQSVCLGNGYYMDIPECQEVHNDYSYNRSTNWARLPESDCDLWEEIKEYVLAKYD